MSLELPPLPHLADKFTLEEMQAYARAAQRLALEEALRQVGRACEYSVDSPCAGAYKDQAEQAINAIRKLTEEITSGSSSEG